MAVTAKMYSHFPTHLLNALFVGLGSETAIKCMLCTSAYTPSQDNHDFKADITNEVTGAGYTAGGAVLTATVVSVAARVTTYDAADVEWTSSTITARYAVLYDNTQGTDATRPIIMLIDFGEDKSSENGTFKIAWNAAGIFTVTVAA